MYISKDMYICKRELLEGSEISAAGLREDAKPGVLSLCEASIS